MSEYIYTIAPKRILRVLCELVEENTGFRVYEGSTPMDKIGESGWIAVASSCYYIGSKDAGDFCGYKKVSIDEFISKIQIGKTIEIKLNKTYKAQVTRNCIKVECQEFPLSVIDALVDARNKVLNQ